MKQKSSSGTKKRFKLTGTGKVKRRKAFRSHILSSKTPKRKRNLRKSALVSPTEDKKIKQMLRG